MNNRYKNVYFWVGLVGVILTAMGVDASTFTSWSIVLEQLQALVMNPFMLFSVALAVLGVFVEPTSKGIKDQDKE